MKYRINILFAMLFVSFTSQLIAQENYKVIIPCQYSNISTFASNDLAFAKKENKMGYVDQTGKIVVDFQFDDAKQFSPNGLAGVKKGNKWGFIDQKGNIVISIQYDNIKFICSNNFIGARKGYFYGFIDETGKEIIPFNYENILEFSSNGLAGVKKNEKWGFIDESGQTVIDFKFDFVKNFSPNGLAGVLKKKKWGFIDQKGNLVIDYQFENVERFESNGLAPVFKNKKWGFIDQKGNLVIDYQFEKIGKFESNGLAPVFKNEKWGFIDHKGQTVVDFKYDLAYNYISEGLIRVKLNNKWGYLDQTGKELIDCIYDFAQDFVNGYARVKKGNKWGFIDAKGNVVIDFQYDDTGDFSQFGIACIKKGGKWGCINQDGKTIINNQYDLMGKIASNGVITVKNDINWGSIRLFVPTAEITEYIKSEINKWQEKGKYETTEAYKERVTEVNRQKKLEELSNIAVQKTAPNFCNWETIKTDYDADNQTFKINVNGLSPFYLNVPLNEAEDFDKSIKNIEFQDKEYALGSNGNFFLQKATIKNPNNGKIYDFSSTDKAVFAYTQLNMNFEPININLNSGLSTTNVKTETRTVSVGLSDIDINIPSNPQTNDNTFVVIIANENYSREVKVDYASNDGKIFKEYCEKTMGIPAKNIHLVQDATFGNIKSEINWISDVAQAYNGQAKLIFYYAGHGMPNEADKSSYLLPVDGISSDYETAIKLDELYTKLGQYPTQGVTVFLDACFSGSVRDNGMLANARGVKIKPKAELPKGKMIVLTAATGDETAYPYKEKQHGLFTYFLLKKLQETKGNVDYQTLSSYITEQVKQQSIVVNQKSQTPQVITSPELQGSWQEMKIK